MDLKYKEIRDNNLNDLIILSDNIKQSTSRIRNNLNLQKEKLGNLGTAFTSTHEKLTWSNFKVDDMKRSIGSNYWRIIKMIGILIVLLAVIIYL